MATSKSVRSHATSRQKLPNGGNSSQRFGKMVYSSIDTEVSHYMDVDKLAISLPKSPTSPTAPLSGLDLHELTKIKPGLAAYLHGPRLKPIKKTQPTSPGSPKSKKHIMSATLPPLSSLASSGPTAPFSKNSHTTEDLHGAIGRSIHAIETHDSAAERQAWFAVVRSAAVPPSIAPYSTMQADAMHNAEVAVTKKESKAVADIQRDIVLMAASEGLVYHRAFGALDTDGDGLIVIGNAPAWAERYHPELMAQAQAIDMNVYAAISEQKAVAGDKRGVNYQQFVRMMRRDTTNTFRSFALAVAETNGDDARAALVHRVEAKNNDSSPDAKVKSPEDVVSHLNEASQLIWDFVPPTSAKILAEHPEFRVAAPPTNDAVTGTVDGATPNPTPTTIASKVSASGYTPRPFETFTLDSETWKARELPPPVGTTHLPKPLALPPTTPLTTGPETSHEHVLARMAAYAYSDIRGEVRKAAVKQQVFTGAASQGLFKSSQQTTTAPNSGGGGGRSTTTTAGAGGAAALRADGALPRLAARAEAIFDTTHKPPITRAQVSPVAKEKFAGEHFGERCGVAGGVSNPNVRGAAAKLLQQAFSEADRVISRAMPKPEDEEESTTAAAPHGGTSHA